LIDLSKDSDGPGDKLEMLIALGGSEVSRRGNVAVAGDEEVAGVIGVAVQHDEVLFTAEEDIVSGVVIFGGFITKDTTGGFNSPDILDPPRRPDMFHITLALIILSFVEISVKKKGAYKGIRFSFYYFIVCS